jgi:hypothetical protein
MNIEDEIQALKARNAKVESDKEWETSLFRKIAILVITYILAFCLMVSIGVEQAYLNALIPTLGFFLSTLSLAFLKSFWIEKIYKK